MKKLLCLCLSLVMCLSVLPAFAEEAAAELTIQKPMLAADYEAAVLNFAEQALAAEVKVEWVDSSDETIRMLIVDGAAIGVAYIREGELADELMFYSSGTLDEAQIEMLQTLMLFVAAPLLMDAGADVTTAATLVMQELFAAFVSGELINAQIDWRGLPAVMIIQSAETEDAYTYQFFLDFIPETAEAAE